MSILSFSDQIYALRFLRLLTMPFEKTKAYELDVIDQEGKLKKPYTELSQEQKDSYTLFHRLVFNIRRLLLKIPLVGKSILVNYATALLMLKENTKLNDEDIIKIINESFTINLLLDEETNIEELKQNHIYVLKHDLLDEKTFEPIFKNGTQVIILGESDKSFVDIHFYKAKHIQTEKCLLVCSGDVVTSPTNTVELLPPQETKDMLITPKKKAKKKNKDKDENI
jgi:hypothetical protein